MEQLIMQTQQSADLKPKLSVKKSKQSKEKKTDFGEALQSRQQPQAALRPRQSGHLRQKPMWKVLREFRQRISSV